MSTHEWADEIELSGRSFSCRPRLYMAVYQKKVHLTIKIQRSDDTIFKLFTNCMFVLEINSTTLAFSHFLDLQQTLKFRDYLR